MQVIETALAGVKIIEPDVYGDSRGYFMETWNAKRYGDAGIDYQFLQDNISTSEHGVLRGLHYQYENIQGKLVYVLQGSVYDVAVDVRRGSDSFGQWVGVELSADNKRQLIVPPGFAHGFCVTSDSAMFAYKCTDIYNHAAEVSVFWNDPDININWPIKAPLLSKKDHTASLLKDIPREYLPEL